MFQRIEVSNCTYLSVKWIVMKMKRALKFMCVFLRHHDSVSSTIENFPFFYFLRSTPEYIIGINE